MKTKKILSLIIAVMLALQGTASMALTSFAADIPGTLTVESAVAKAGETVSLDVKLKNNPGMSAMTLSPVYDATVLKLNSITVGEGKFENATVRDKYVWTSSVGDVRDNGKVLTMEFKVLDTAAFGSTEVSVAYDGSNWTEKTPNIKVIAGAVSIVTEKSGLLKTTAPEHCYTGQTVEIPVVLEKNPGVSAIKIEPVFDESVFEFVEFKGGEGEFANATMLSGYVWTNMGDYTEDGTVCKMVLKVRDTAPHADTTVSVNFNSSNWDEKTPDIFPIAGTISVHNASDIVTDAAADVTCTTDGYTEGSHCSVCGDVIVAQQIIPAKGHDFDEKFTVDFNATSTAPGQKSRHCKNCDAVTDITEIPLVQSDINGDGDIDTKDLTRLMKFISGQDVTVTNPDINGDGKMDTKDLTRLMKYLAGYEV